MPNTTRLYHHFRDGFSAFIFLPRALRTSMKNMFAVVLMFAVLANVSAAQQLDSSMLQAEAAAGQSQQAAPRQPAPDQTSAAPQNPQPAKQNPQPSAGPSSGVFTIPAGTKLPLGLLRPISVKSSDPVADVYLQVTFPVTVGGQMLIPPGAYIQGVIEKTIPRPRGSAGPGFSMRYANLIFATGYTVPIAGTVNVMRTTAQALPLNDKEGQPVTATPATETTAGDRPPDTVQHAPLQYPSFNMNGMPLLAMSAFGASLQQLPPLPPLPPLPKSGFGNTPRNIMIGVGVAATVGMIAAFALGHRSSNDLIMETGTPLELVLPAPLELDAEHANAAVRLYSSLVAVAPPDIVKPPEKPKMCYDPGSPGTPDTVIPGSPGTLPTVIPGMNGAPDTVIPGSPATPDTVIPGTPGTPSSSYPCPK